MASNPMKKKSRNSFFLGMLLMLILIIIIAGAAYFLIIVPQQQKESKEEALTYVYRLKNDIGSGQTITPADVEEIVVTSKVVPAGSFASRVKKTDKNGKESWNTKKSFPGNFFAKVDLNKGTIITDSMVKETEGDIANDLRYVEYNMLTLSTTVNVGDFVDIRLTLPNGQDLIVISKKEVKSLLGYTLGFNLTEGDIVMMESAIVEAYTMKGSKLYVAQYVEPGMQEEAIKTYTPTEAVVQLVNGDANIVSEAREALTKRYSEALRSWVDSAKGVYVTEEKQNIEAGIQKELENSKKAREAYLSGLTSY